MDSQNQASALTAGQSASASRSGDRGRWMPRLAVLTNLVPPYRVPVFRALGEQFDLSVFTSAGERNRDWEHYAAQLPNVQVHKSAGMSITVADRDESGVFDLRFVHFNPGYLLDLIRTRPQAIISGEMGFRTICALAYGWVTRIPVWVWWGGTVHTEAKIGPTRRFLRRFLSRLARRWISYGQTSTDYLRSLGVSRDRIVQIQNCVDEKKFAADAPPAIAVSPRPLLLYVGQLLQRKGLRQLVESAARLRDAGHQFTLVLVGNGPQRDPLLHLAGRLKLQNVQFLPSQPPESMSGIYRSADCLVFPTLEDVWGLVVNEAMWCGIPVVSSIFAGCTSEIVPPENRFNPLDHQDFDRILLKAISGKIAAPETDVLRTAAQVAEIIATAVQRELQSLGASRPRVRLPHHN